MSYTIKFTNGRTLAVIADQSYDQISTSLTLIGKNLNNYGQYINENFVGLLENFAYPIEPRNPVTGQLWYDTGENKIKVYNAGRFKPVGSPTVSSTEPVNPIAGDLWVDTTEGILKWFDGGIFVPAGKTYTDQNGKEGWFTETIADLSNNDYTVSIYYAGDDRLAVLTDQTIELNPGTYDYFNTSTIRPGLTFKKDSGLKFYGVATSAETVAGFDPSNIWTLNTYTETTGDMWIRNDAGLQIGETAPFRFYVDTSTTPDTSVIASADAILNPLEIRYNSISTGTQGVAIHVNPVSERIGVFTNAPAASFDVNGDVVIRGNVTVRGTSTILETEILRVEDPIIELATNQETPSDNALLDGGGLIVHGDSDYSWLVNINSGGVPFNRAWEPSLSINLPDNSLSYKISNFSLLEADPDRPGYFRLGTFVTAAPGLVNLPILQQLTVSNVVLYGNTVTTSVFPPTDLSITPSSGSIDLGNTTKIVNMAETLDADGRDIAVSKGYFEDKLALALGGFVGRKPYTLSLDITDFININTQIIEYLNLTIPVDGFDDPYYAQPDGSRCSVICTRYIATTATYYLDSLNTSTERQEITYVPEVAGTYTNTLTVVTDFELAGSITISTPMPIIQRTIKLFQVVAGFWTFVRDVDNEYLRSTDSIYIADIDRAVIVPTITPISTSLSRISLSTLNGVRKGHIVTGTSINTVTQVISLSTTTTEIEIDPPLTSLLTVGEDLTFLYAPGGILYISGNGPATLQTGTSVIVQDRTTQLNILSGTLIDNENTTSYLNTVTIAVSLESVIVGSTGTYSNWLISLGGGE
jgi:hypothetical protein